MKNAQTMGKNVIYHLGYSNYTFELWMILHMTDCNGTLSHRRDYLPLINRAFNEHFENLNQYKSEANFKRILNKLTLDHVRQAIVRSKNIMQRNKLSGYIVQQYKGYQFFNENPSLSIWEIIEQILMDCSLIQKSHN